MAALDSSVSPSQHTAVPGADGFDPEIGLEPRLEDESAVRASLTGWRDMLAAYVGLMKPRVIELLLLTTVPVMFFAKRGVPDLQLVVATVVGGTLSAGAANVLNCVYDRDIDEHMRRTRRRALPRHVVTPTGAMVFGLALMVASTIILGDFVNWLSSGLALAASAFYLFGYTMILKRRTTQNIVWGGIAGCFPTMIGWTAVTGRLNWAPFVLFLVVFFWTPPHTWALAMRYREDYARVDVPMLPVRRDAHAVAKQIVAYSWVMVATSLLLWPIAHTSWFYPAVAVVLGAAFLTEAHMLLKRAGSSNELSVVRPMRLFHWSNMYLSLLMVAVALSPLISR